MEIVFITKNRVTKESLRKEFSECSDLSFVVNGDKGRINDENFSVCAELNFQGDQLVCVETSWSQFTYTREGDSRWLYEGARKGFLRQNLLPHFCVDYVESVDSEFGRCKSLEAYDAVIAPEKEKAFKALCDRLGFWGARFALQSADFRRLVRETLKYEWTEFESVPAEAVLVGRFNTEEFRNKFQ